MLNIKEKLNNNQDISQNDFIHIDYNDKNIKKGLTRLESWFILKSNSNKHKWRK